ncbi:MAG: hypothetical protein KJ000_36285 [Pirellulaceae bacterium]|nr:hypothetical protein [Pirellulaceae bacterium]
MPAGATFFGATDCAGFGASDELFVGAMRAEYFGERTTGGLVPAAGFFGFVSFAEAESNAQANPTTSPHATSSQGYLNMAFTVLQAI